MHPRRGAGYRRNVRIAIVCPYSWTAAGGVQSHVRGLARELRRRGAEVDVVAPADGPVEDGVIAVGRTLTIPDNGSRVPVALSPAAVARTARLVRRGGHDVVHLHEPMIPAVSLTALLAAPGARVGTFHMYASGPRWYRPFGPLCRAALARLDARIAVSDAARRHVARTCPGAYEIIPNGVHPPAAPPAPREGDAPRIVFVGRGDRRKGLPVLLEAFGRLADGVRLDVVGVPARRGAALAAALPPGAARRVTFHGRVPDERRDTLLAGADVLCAPALGGESFGLVLAEAMAAGVPVVASDVDGYRELVGGLPQALVPPGDPAATARALETLLADPGLRARAGAAGRARAAALTWEAVTDRVVAVYERALDARRRSTRPAFGRPAHPSHRVARMPTGSRPERSSAPSSARAISGVGAGGVWRARRTSS